MNIHIGANRKVPSGVRAPMGRSLAELCCTAPPMPTKMKSKYLNIFNINQNKIKIKSNTSLTYPNKGRGGEAAPPSYFCICLMCLILFWLYFDSFRIYSSIFIIFWLFVITSRGGICALVFVDKWCDLLFASLRNNRFMGPAWDLQFQVYMFIWTYISERIGKSIRALERLWVDHLLSSAELRHPCRARPPSWTVPRSVAQER